MSSEAVIFPFLDLPAAPMKRPLVWVSLENPHNAYSGAFVFPALIDTGADCSVISSVLCRRLGHDFAAGSNAQNLGGIGGDSVQSSRHSTKLAVLVTPAGGGIPPPASRAFPPLEMRMDFINQRLPFMLLGQSDFLSSFEYRQHRGEGWFSLRRY